MQVRSDIPLIIGRFRPFKREVLNQFAAVCGGSLQLIYVSKPRWTGYCIRLFRILLQLTAEADCFHYEDSQNSTLVNAATYESRCEIKQTHARIRTHTRTHAHTHTHTHTHTNFIKRKQTTKACGACTFAQSYSCSGISAFVVGCIRFSTIIFVYFTFTKFPTS